MHTVPLNIKTALVITPPVRDFYFTHHRFTSLGASLVAELLVKRGIRTIPRNFALLRKKPILIPLPEDLSYLKPHILEKETGKTSFFTRCKHFGPEIKECGSIIRSLNPDICFISCFAWCYGSTAVELAEEIKTRMPSCPVVLGGAGVSAFPEFFLRSKGVDYTITGEAEVSLYRFLDYLQGKTSDPDDIPNLGWKNRDDIYFSRKEFTSKEQIEPAIYISPAFKALGSSNVPSRISVSISRGCSLDCSFCSNRICHGDEFKLSSFSKIQESINSLIPKSGVSPSDVHILNFEDDNLLLDFQFWVECIKEFKRYFPDVRIYAENGLDYRLLTPQRCHELIKLGMAQFNFSLASTDNSILKESKRNADFSRYDELLSIAENAKIPVITYFICGLPLDTRETVVENLLFLQKRPTEIGISLFYPVPGIKGFEDKHTFNNLSPAMCTGSAAYPWNNSLSTQTMITAFRLARFINLQKSDNLSGSEQALVDVIAEKRRLYTYIRTDSGIKLKEIGNQDYELVDMYFSSLD